MTEREDEKTPDEESLTLFHFVLARPGEDDDDADDAEDNKDMVLWEHRLQHGRCPHCGNLTHIYCNGGADASSAAVLVPRNVPPLVKRGVCTHPDCQPEQRFVPCYFTPSQSKNKNKEGASSINTSDSPLAAVDEWLREMREKYKQLKKAKNKKGKQRPKALVWLFEDVLTQLSRAVTDFTSRSDHDNCDKQELLEKLEDMEMQLDGGRSLLDELQREIGQDLSAGKIAIQRLMDYESGTDDESGEEKGQSDDKQEPTASTMARSIATMASTITDSEVGSEAHPGDNTLDPPNNRPRQEQADHNDHNDSAQLITHQQGHEAALGCDASMPAMVTTPDGMGNTARMAPASGGVMAAKARWERRSARRQSQNGDPHIQGCRDAERGHGTMPLGTATSTSPGPEPLVYAQAQDDERLVASPRMASPGEGQPIVGRLDTATAEKGGAADTILSLTAPSYMPASMSLSVAGETTAAPSLPPREEESLVVTSTEVVASVSPAEAVAINNSSSTMLASTSTLDGSSTLAASNSAFEINEDEIVAVPVIVVEPEAEGPGDGGLIRSQQSQIRFLRERVEQLDQGQQLRLSEIAQGIQRLQQFSSSVASEDGSEHGHGIQQLHQLCSNVASSDGGSDRGANQGSFDISTDESSASSRTKNKLKKETEVKAIAENMKTRDGVYTGEILIQRQRFQLSTSHLRHGIGTMTYKAGDTYEGEWRKDKRHGKGTYKRPDGKEYVGDWVKDYANGNGVMKLPDGSVYTGGFKNHKRHGKGVLKKRDGSSFDCEWFDDVQNGKGKYTSPDGQEREVFFKDGRMVKKK